MRGGIKIILEEFIKKLDTDPAFAKKFSEVKSKDEVIKIAKSEGYDFENLSEEEFAEISCGNWFEYVGKIFKI